MGKLIIVYGATASGKDTLLREMQDYGVMRLTSYTTRPMREGEEDGVEYRFVTKEKFDEDLANDMVIEHREYTIANGDTWYYYFKKNTIDLSDNNTYCCIADLNGAIDLINYYGKANTVAVYVNTPVEICVHRALDRERRTITDMKVKEICRRMVSDIDEIVTNPKALEIADKIISLEDSDDMYDLCEEIGLYSSVYIPELEGDGND